MIDAAKWTTQSWSFFWYMAAGNMQIQWIRASPAVGAPQDNRRAKYSTSWGAIHLRRMKREDVFPAVGAPRTIIRQKVIGWAKKKDAWGNMIGCCFRRRPWGSSGLGGVRIAELSSSDGLQDYEDTRLKTSSRVRMGLSLAWKASLAIRICRSPTNVTDSV